MDKEILQRFNELACDLSPENLHCDGEISNAEANRKYRRIMKEWHELEKKVGRKVSESEIWKENRKLNNGDWHKIRTI